MKTTFGFIEYQLKDGTIVVCQAKDIQMLLIDEKENTGHVFFSIEGKDELTYDSACALRGLLTSITMESPDEKLGDLRGHH